MRMLGRVLPGLTRLARLIVCFEALIIVACGPYDSPMCTPTVPDDRGGIERPLNGSGNDPVLVGGTWNLLAIDGAPLIDNTAITLEFRAQELIGSTGCNYYGGGPDSGAYSTSNGRFSMDMLAVTVQLCLEPNGIMDQEERYLAAFRLITAYQVTDVELKLLDREGNVRLVYVRNVR